MVTNLRNEHYLERINCEFGVVGDRVFDDLGVAGVCQELAAG